MSEVSTESTSPSKAPNKIDLGNPEELGGKLEILGGKDNSRFWVSWITEGIDKTKVKNVKNAAIFGIFYKCAERMGEELFSLIETFSPLSPAFCDVTKEIHSEGKCLKIKLGEIQKVSSRLLEPFKKEHEKREGIEETRDIFFKRLSKQLSVDIIVYSQQITCEGLTDRTIEGKSTYLVKNPKCEVRLWLKEVEEETKEYSIGILTDKDHIVAKELNRILQKYKACLESNTDPRGLIGEIGNLRKYKHHTEKLEQFIGSLKKKHPPPKRTHELADKKENPQDENSVKESDNETGLEKSAKTDEEVKSAVHPSELCKYCGSHDNVSNLIKLSCNCMTHRKCVEE